MMLLLDGTFPATAEIYGELDFTLIRWNGARLSDQDLIETAADSGFAGVIFLGQALLSRSEIPAAARARRLYLAATAESSPPLALRALATNVNALRRRVRANGVDVIYARDVRDHGPLAAT
jgi:hypothetical protein